MPIWNYESLAHPFDLGFTAHLLNRYTCFYCKSLLQDSEHIDCIAAGDEAILKRCNACGWWYVEEIDYGSTHMRSYGGFARLKALDINDIATPTEEARSFLLAQYKKRHEMHPRLFEETVGSIMRELGYATRVTAYHGDNGIDIYLDGPNGTLIGVQVKRWKHSIKIEQIHSLGGALLVNRCTKGIFVATSSFQRGAVANAQHFTDITGIPIQLVDAEKLYDALRITSAPTPWNARDPNAPWNKTKRPRLWTV